MTHHALRKDMPLLDLRAPLRNPRNGEGHLLGFDPPGGPANDVRNDLKRSPERIWQSPCWKRSVRNAARLDRILELASRGLSNAAIAYDVGTSEATVSRALSTSRGRALKEEAAQVFSAWAELTDAEQAVADLALQGHRNAAIAARRNASPRTVANQLATVYRKLRVCSRRQLLAAALRTGRKA